MRFILKDIREWKIRYDVLRFGVLLLVVVIIWAGIELFNTYSTTTISEDYLEHLEPFNPSLDLEMIAEIESRVDAPENFEVLKTEDEEEVGEQQTQTASPSSVLTSSPTATGSGN